MSVFWAALAVLAAFGVLRARRGHDLSPALGLTVLGPGETFDSQQEYDNLDGVKVQFGAAHEADDSVVHRGAVKVGDHYLALPAGFEGGSFVDLIVSEDQRHWLAVECFDTEAMGDLQLVASDDGGRTFVHRGTFPWPTYMANLKSVTVDGENVIVELSLDEDSQLSEPWWSWLERARVRLQPDSYYPSLSAGQYRVRSSNGGHSFGGLQKI